MLGVEEEIRGMLAPPSPDRYGLVMDIETSRSKGSPEPVIEAHFRVVEAAAVKRTLAGAERGGRATESMAAGVETHSAVFLRSTAGKAGRVQSTN